MDVARYKPYNSKKVSEHNYFKQNKSVGRLEGDSDIDALDMKLRSGGRYWSAKYAAIERHKNLKRMRVLATGNPVMSSIADYIPLVDEGSDSGPIPNVKVVEESWEDEVLRKTKEFNKMTREHPKDESIWLAFAEFQDKVLSMQPHKGARLQTLEKKISILEKAIELNPDSEDLLLSLMKAYQSRDSTDVLIRRWERILTSNSGSCKLWKEFLRVVQGEFSRFKVSEMRKMYANAVQALAGACMKQHRQVHDQNLFSAYYTYNTETHTNTHKKMEKKETLVQQKLNMSEGFLFTEIGSDMSCTFSLRTSLNFSALFILTEKNLLVAL